MNSGIKVAVIGGDKRSAVIAEELLDRGFDIRSYGVPGRYNSENSWRGVIKSVKYVILPLPVSRDGLRIFCASEEIYLADFLSALENETVLLGGNVSGNCAESIKSSDVRYVDYYDREEVLLRNASLTAEAATGLAILENEKSLDSSVVGVLGYGRIGKELSWRLNLLGAKVMATSRKEDDLTEIRAKYYGAIDARQSGAFEFIEKGLDIVFNTIDAPIISEEILNRTDRNTLILDLASSPGGVDDKAAEKAGIRVIHALGLPGKYFPLDAGKILAGSIVQILSEGDCKL